ncbi:MAG: hypothetical protein JJT87_09745 [Halomonas sp.]|uniref:hypothetical protein n=1 Tax=unclassified Halomonas TaxID=2609666 RepID=UPI0018657B98|nr:MULTISPECIES: hypothetical protein [unclassified Halomonas]MCC5902199.1 hypothetical protein [Halomonas sp.]
MKAFTLVTAIAMALFSGVALAERGSSEDNQIIHAESTAQHQTVDTKMTPAELRDRNP